MPTYFDIPDMFGRYINEVPGGGAGWLPDVSKLIPDTWGRGPNISRYNLDLLIKYETLSTNQALILQLTCNNVNINCGVRQIETVRESTPYPEILITLNSPLPHSCHQIYRLYDDKIEERTRDGIYYWTITNVEVVEKIVKKPSIIIPQEKGFGEF